MLKINKTAASLCLSFAGLIMFAQPVFAIPPQVSIQKLNSYINSNNFKLSCSALGGTSAQFSVSKNGGSFTDFGGVIDLTTTACLVQVSASEINDETSYVFKATLNSGQTDQTATTYDISATSPVAGYSKERIDDGTYKLKWTNPGNADFDKVIIYRGEAAGFSADDGHEIARVGGSPNSDMSYNDDFPPDANKNYFYAIRAIDHAGNSSSLAGDAGATTTSQGILEASTDSTGNNVTSLPAEKGTGSVLGGKTTASPTPEAVVSTPEPASASSGPLNWILTHKKISLGVAGALLLGAYLLYYFRKQNH